MAEKNIYHRLPVKPCYSHIGGKLGALLLEQFITNGWLEKDRVAGRSFYITPDGEKAFIAMGIDLSRIRPE